MKDVYWILPGLGNVLVVTHRCRGIEFIWAYCRTACLVEGRILCPEVMRHYGGRTDTFEFGALDPAVHGLDIAPQQPWMNHESH